MKTFNKLPWTVWVTGFEKCRGYMLEALPEFYR